MNQSNARLEKLEQFLKTDPGNQELLKELAAGYQQVGDLEKSLHLYEQLRLMAGDSPALLNEMGSLYLSTGRFDDAIKVLNKATELDSSAAALFYNLGYAEFAAGKPEYARAHYEKAVLMSPQELKFQFDLALCCHELDDEIMARQYYANVLSLDKDHSEARLFTAYLDLRQGKVADAKTNLECLLAKNPNHCDGLVLRAQIALLDLDLTNALQLLQNAQLVCPSNVEVYVLLGQVLIGQQKLTHAKRILEKAIALDSESVPAFICLGWAEVMQNEFSKAEQLFSRVITLSPSEANGCGGMAIVRCAQERHPEAKTFAGDALLLDPFNIPANMVIATYKKSTDPTYNNAIASVSKAIFENNTLGLFGLNKKEMLSNISNSPDIKQVVRKYTRLARRKDKRYTG